MAQSFAALVMGAALPPNAAGLLGTSGAVEAVAGDGKLVVGGVAWDPDEGAAPDFNRTGFYIGGNIGGAFAGGNGLEGSGGRFMGGVQGGADYQFANNWVIGAEAQYDWLSNNNNGGVIFPAGTLVTANTA